MGRMVCIGSSTERLIVSISRQLFWRKRTLTGFRPGGLVDQGLPLPRPPERGHGLVEAIGHPAAQGRATASAAVLALALRLT
jgi:hypothetical protein